MSSELRTSSFESGIRWNGRSKPGVVSVACAILFWCLVGFQIGAGILVFSSKNSSFGTINPNGDLISCPEGYKAVDLCTSLVYWNLELGCVDNNLCSQLSECGTHSLAHRLSSVNRNPEHNNSEIEMSTRSFWSMIAHGWYITVSLVFVAAILGILWLRLVEKFALVMVLGSICVSIASLVGLWVYDFVVLKINNGALLAFAALGLLTLFFFFKRLIRASAIVTLGAKGLFHSKGIIRTCSITKITFLLYVAFWIAVMIQSVQVWEVDSCQLRRRGWVEPTRYLFSLFFCILAYYFANVNTVICAVGIGTWYFPRKDLDRPVYPTMVALKWAFTTMGGNVMVASIVVGFTRFVIQRITNLCKCLPWFLSPVACVCRCFSGGFLKILQIFTKYMLIGMVFSGTRGLQSAKDSFYLIKSKLGDVFLLDAMGHNLAMVGPWALSFALGMLAWLWFDKVEGVDSLKDLNGYALFGLLIMYAIMISYPFVSIMIIVFFSAQLEVAKLNCGMGAVFVGSLCYCLLHFLGEVLLSCCDSIFFCYAIEVENGEVQERFGDLYEVMSPYRTVAEEEPLGSSV